MTIESLKEAKGSASAAKCEIDRALLDSACKIYRNSDGIGIYRTYVEEGKSLELTEKIRGLGNDFGKVFVVVERTLDRMFMSSSGYDAGLNLITVNEKGCSLLMEILGDPGLSDFVGAVRFGVYHELGHQRPFEFLRRSGAREEGRTSPEFMATLHSMKSGDPINDMAGALVLSSLLSEDDYVRDAIRFGEDGRVVATYGLRSELCNKLLSLKYHWEELKNPRDLADDTPPGSIEFLDYGDGRGTWQAVISRAEELMVNHSDFMRRYARGECSDVREREELAAWYNRERRRVS